MKANSTMLAKMLEYYIAKGDIVKAKNIARELLEFNVKIKVEVVEDKPIDNEESKKINNQ